LERDQYVLKSHDRIRQNQTNVDYFILAFYLLPGVLAHHARLDLAKMYLKRKKPDLAKRELLAIVNADRPRDPYAWAKEYRPEAARLLESLNHAQ
jgi:hypothetical protein